MVCLGKTAECLPWHQLPHSMILARVDYFLDNYPEIVIFAAVNYHVGIN
jgi:hypothetical protein